MEGVAQGSYLTTTSPHFDLPGLVTETLRLQDHGGDFEEDPNWSPAQTPASSPTLSTIFALEDPESIDILDLDMDESIQSPSRFLNALDSESIDDFKFDLDIDKIRSLSPTLTASLAPSSPARSPSKASTSSKKKKVKSLEKKKPKITDDRRLVRNAASSASRARKRSALKAKKVHQSFEPRPRTVERHVGKAEKIECHIQTQELPIANGAHVGLDNGSGRRRTYTLEELIGEKSKWKFRLQEWDGEKTFALVDDQNRVIGILAGHPDDPDWPAALNSATEAMKTKQSRCHVSKEEKKRAHRCGKFVALRCGVSHGGGQKRPGNLRNVPANERVLDELNELEPFQRLTGFASSVTATWCPKLYDHYKTNVEALHDHHPELIRVFPNSVHSGFSYNLGHKTVCYTHTDYGNYAVGMCAVTPLGHYDYKKGGHLVLWDLKLVIEFPPGCTILIPSAIIAHSNTSIQKDETRYSFAQYTAGGLFRWVDNNFKTREEYLAELTPEQLVADREKQEGRLEYALSLLRVLPK